MSASIQGKKLSDRSASEGEVTDEDESAETNRISRGARKAAAGRKIALCKELSDLIAPFLVSSRIRDLQNARMSRHFVVQMF